MNPARADLISPLDIFKIGIGPSSSHTMGPMMAALKFRSEILAAMHTLKDAGDLRLEVELFGSLSATGRGHATDGAVCAGLTGLHPTDAQPDEIWAVMPRLIENPCLEFDGLKVAFNPDTNIIWDSWLMDGEGLPHPNTMRFRLKHGDDIKLEHKIISVGGGFVETLDKNNMRPSSTHGDADGNDVPYPFNTADEYVAQSLKNQIEPWSLVIANQERLGLTEEKLRADLNRIIDTMFACIDQGLNTDGILPGGLNVRRRAKSLYDRLKAPGADQRSVFPAAINDLRPSIYAMAVNEENAAGGRVCTAPTNGSSGLIPAVWRTLQEDYKLSREILQNGLIVAAAIGALVKVHASISGAEVGCQGEVGTSCAMAAGGAVAMLGGNVRQIEQAAEIRSKDSCRFRASSATQWVQ